MSRVKENKELMDFLGKQVELMNELGVDATDGYCLGNMVVVLCDISKSLAVIADRLSEENNDSRK